MCLEEYIIAIQDKLDIVGYSNQERAEEVDENMRTCLRKLEEFHGPLEDDPGVILPKYGEMGVKKIMFTGEGFQYFQRSLLSNCTKYSSKIQLAPVNAHV